MLLFVNICDFGKLFTLNHKHIVIVNHVKQNTNMF